MAMGWLKGLVAPVAQGLGGQGPNPGMPQYSQHQGGPPIGGTPYGVAQGMPPGNMPPPGTPPIGAPGGPPPYDASQLPSAMQWSTGTRTQGSPQGGIDTGGASSGGVSAGGPQPGEGSLEARCAQLQHDVESLALFARTLLTMLEESKLVTREQFDATKHRLDMLDGKLDDR